MGVIGILLALFLLWERYFHPTFQPCNINSTVNCNAVISGAVSNTLGIPTPLIGLIGYIFILYGAFKKNAKLILGMSTFGLAFCLSIKTPVPIPPTKSNKARTINPRVRKDFMLTPFMLALLMMPQYYPG